MNGFEVQILLWIQENLRGFMDAFWVAITSLADKGWFWILLAVMLLIFKKTRMVGVTMLVSLIINHFMTNMLLKDLFGRPRPYNVSAELETLIKQLSSYSFPSGHTSSSFAAAFIMYRMLPKKAGIPALVLAAMIGFSRMYVGVHYPTDVLGGIVVAFMSSVWAHYLVQMIQKKMQKRTEQSIEEKE